MWLALMVKMTLLICYLDILLLRNCYKNTGIDEKRFKNSSFTDTFLPCRHDHWEYECAFDPNQLDNFNQTPLYIACLSGNDYIIGCLLNWRLICTNTTKQKCQMLLSPIDLNVQCAFVKETALMAAVRGGFLYIVFILLRNGINPNIYNSNIIDDDLGTEDCIGNTVLIEAVRQRSFSMTEILLRFGAEDTNSCALKIAIENADEELIHCILARHSREDPEHKLNETDLLTGSDLGQILPSYCNTYRNLFPTNPTVIDWSSTNYQLQEIQ